MTAPPDDVFRALLEGGPADGIEMEIEPGQATLELTPLQVEGTPRVRASDWPTYRFSGRLDRDRRAVFIPSADQPGP